MKKIFFNLLTVICIVVIFIASYQIYFTLNHYKKANTIYSELKTQKENSISSKNLLEINDDYKFWIEIEGTNIDYPVVQSDNNKFYLDHDFNKNYLPAGSIFLDYKNNFLEDYNSIIYGHHMRNSTMFGQLEKFKDNNFFKKNKIITLTDYKNNIYKYEVFAIGIYNTNFGYDKINFNNHEEFNTFLNKILNNSIYHRSIKKTTKKIITLVTCSYEYDNARTVVFAVKL